MQLNTVSVQYVRSSKHRVAGGTDLRAVALAAAGPLEDYIFGFDVPVHDIVIVEVVHSHEQLLEDRRCDLLGVTLQLQQHTRSR